MRSTAAAKGGGDGGVASFVASVERNPFVLPSDEEVFQMREHERERRDALRESQAGQKLWERGDASSLAMTRKMISQIGACPSDVGVADAAVLQSVRRPVATALWRPRLLQAPQPQLRVARSLLLRAHDCAGEQLSHRLYL